MESVSLFHDDWYEKMIRQQLDSDKGASPDARIQARAIMAAGAFIAEAIGHAFDESKHGHNNTYSALSQLSDAVDGLGEILSRTRPKS